MAFCQNCGTKLEHGEAYCPNCGNKVSDQGHVSPSQRVQPAYTASATGELRATGGLKVWLWILIVCGIIMIIYDLFTCVTSRFRVEIILSAVTLAIEIYGASLMLKAFKKGFYILVICTCIGAVFSAFSNTYALYTLGLMFSLLCSAIGALVSVGIIWLFARKQWPNFR